MIENQGSGHPFGQQNFKKMIYDREVNDSGNFLPK
jgi:hypothetical protein